jgi:serine/threonine protein kinase
MPWDVSENLLRDKIYLGDFIAIRPGTPVNYIPQEPPNCCGPERYHNVAPSFASDMWSYMCIFAALYIGFLPFTGPFGDYVMWSWVNALGPMPEHWKGYYTRPGRTTTTRDEWYGPFQRVGMDPELSLAEKVAKRRPDISNAELQLALEVLRKVFRYEPEHRLTAT